MEACDRLDIRGRLTQEGGEGIVRRISIREIRSALSHVEELLENEGEVIITRHGKPVARVLPVDRPRPIPSRRDLRQSMQPLPVQSEELVRRERDEG
jgi:prevent-host-death family protein